jgi:hypothetical protein
MNNNEANVGIMCTMTTALKAAERDLLYRRRRIAARGKPSPWRVHQAQCNVLKSVETRRMNPENGPTCGMTSWLSN